MTLNELRKLYREAEGLYVSTKGILKKEMEIECKCQGCLERRECWKANFYLLCYNTQLKKCLNRK